MKILTYIPAYAPAWKFGGTVVWIYQLCEGLVTLGHEVEVFTSNAGITDDSNLEVNQPTMKNGVKVTYFQQEPGMGIKCSGMADAVTQRAKEFDLIHIIGVWQRTSGAACKAAKNYQVPYIVSLQGALGPYSWRQKTLKKTLYYLWQEGFNISHASAIHYATQQEEKECRWLKLPSNFFIVPNGLDTQFWQPQLKDAKRWREKQGFTEDDFIILNVGRLHHKKGLDLLPSALQPLLDIRWKMVFVGGDDDGTKTYLEKLFEKANLSEKVHFIPGCNPQQLPTIYSAANLFVLPSRHENFGNVVAEALACGCPVLISDKVGFHYELTEAGVGWVLPRVARKWTTLLGELLQSRDRLQALGIQGRKWANSVFSLSKTSEQMAHYYQKTIDRYHGQ